MKNMDSNATDPLVYAARHGYLVDVRELVEKGFDVDSRNSSGDTELIWAADRGRGLSVESRRRRVGQKSPRDQRGDERGPLHGARLP